MAPRCTNVNVARTGQCWASINQGDGRHLVDIPYQGFWHGSTTKLNTSQQSRKGRRRHSRISINTHKPCHPTGQCHRLVIAPAAQGSAPLALVLLAVMPPPGSRKLCQAPLPGPPRSPSLPACRRCHHCSCPQPARVTPPPAWSPACSRRAPRVALARLAAPPPAAHAVPVATLSLQVVTPLGVPSSED